MALTRVSDTSLGHMFYMLTNKKITMEEILDTVEKLDKVGLYSIELCEGSSFEISLRYLKEDPWESIKRIKSKINNTKTQVLLRGRSLNGYDYFSNDVVKYFIEKVAATGIDIVRVSDPLNDIKNIETVVDACKNEGVASQGMIYYTKSPIHNNEYFVNLAKQMAEMKVDSICVKDIQGLLGPFEAYELVTMLKKLSNIPIHLHISNSNEIALSTYIKSIEAGVDGIDMSAAIINMRSSFSQLELLANALKGTQYDIKLDNELLSDISSQYYSLTHKHLVASMPDNKAYSLKKAYKQITKGMLSNLVYLLKQLNQDQHLGEVIAEAQRIREDLGYPPLAAPISQIIVVQAVINFVVGDRYRMVTEKLKDLVNEEYGRLLVAIKEETRKAILEGETAKQKNLNDIDKTSLNTVKEQMAEAIQKDEDILTYTIFPHYAKELFEGKQEVSPEMLDDSEDKEIDDSEDKEIDDSEQIIEMDSAKNIYETVMNDISMPKVLSIDG